MAHTLCHEEWITCIKFSQDGEYLAVGCEDGTAYIYDVQTGTLTWYVFQDVTSGIVVDLLYAASSEICSQNKTIWELYDGKYLATGSLDRNVYASIFSCKPHPHLLILCSRSGK